MNELLGTLVEQRGALEEKVNQDRAGSEGPSAASFSVALRCFSTLLWLFQAFFEGSRAGDGG